MHFYSPYSDEGGGTVPKCCFSMNLRSYLRGIQKISTAWPNSLCTASHLSAARRTARPPSSGSTAEADTRGVVVQAGCSICRASPTKSGAGEYSSVRFSTFHTRTRMKVYFLNGERGRYSPTTRARLSLILNLTINFIKLKHLYIHMFTQYLPFQSPSSWIDAGIRCNNGGPPCAPSEGMHCCQVPGGGKARCGAAVLSVFPEPRWDQDADLCG
jgi:hypothetical protein